MAIDVNIKLSDLGLFKKPRKNIRGETMSQYERALQIRDAFAHCMSNAMNGTYCIMPDLCASGAAHLDCAHLTVDYSNFTGHGIPLPRREASIIDGRLRATGTLVYRHIYGSANGGTCPGDIHMPALAKKTFPGQKRKAAPPPRKRFFAWLIS